MQLCALHKALPESLGLRRQHQFRPRVENVPNPLRLFRSQFAGLPHHGAQKEAGMARVPLDDAIEGLFGRYRKQVGRTIFGVGDADICSCASDLSDLPVYIIAWSRGRDT